MSPRAYPPLRRHTLREISIRRLVAACALLVALMAAPAPGQVSQLDASAIARQERTMDHYETLLVRVVSARERGDCAEFRDILDIQLTDFDADMRLARLTPEWRHDYERRLDAARGAGCIPAANVEQQRTMDQYEAVLRRMVAARQRGACEEFRDIRSIELTDLDADVSSRRLSPAWRQDYQRRLDEVLGAACIPEAAASAPAPTEAPRNARFDAQLDILRDAQKAGACGPYETFQSVLLPEAAALSVADRRRLAEVLAQGCTPAAGSPWNPVAAIAVPADLPASANSAPAVPAAPAAAASPAAAREPGLNWLVGTWRVPGGDVAVEFRLAPDGTATGSLAAISPALADAGYSVGQAFLRGCKNSPQGQLSIWRYAADCSEGFRDTWQDAGVITVEAGEDAIELPTYVGSPIVGYQKLARVAPPMASPQGCRGFVGKWDTLSGEAWKPGQLELAQDGDMLVGTYDGGPGRIRGRVSSDGTEFRGEMSSWINPDEWLYGVRVTLRLSADGNAFVGNSQTDSWASGWKGTCAASPSSR